MKTFKQRREIMLIGILAAVLAGVLAAPASAEIYRCSDGEITVFSDVPCSQAAEVHVSDRRVSVVHAADDLDEIAESNKAFVEQRQEALAQQRERAKRRQREMQQRQRTRQSIEQAQRYRTVVGHLGNSRLGNPRIPRVDSRTQRQQRSDSSDEPSTRRTLLSRSGGNQRNILR